MENFNNQEKNIIGNRGEPTVMDVVEESLKYRLLGSSDDIASLGYEYIRILAGVVAEEYRRPDRNLANLLCLSSQIVDFYEKYEEADLLGESFDENTCLHIATMGRYLPPPKGKKALEFAFHANLAVRAHPRALHIALHMHNVEFVENIFKYCENHQEIQQLCFIQACHGIFPRHHRPLDKTKSKACEAIINNTILREGYITLARHLKFMELKSLEDIYQAHPIHIRHGITDDSRMRNLVATFVNAFVNAGFGQDLLMTSQSSSWLSENEEREKASAVASLGMISLWDFDSGLALLKRLCDTDIHVTSGALIGIGIVSVNVRNVYHHAYEEVSTLLGSYVKHENQDIKLGAIMGLGLAYADSRDVGVSKMFMEIFSDDAEVDYDVLAYGAISLGLIHMSTGGDDKDRVDLILNRLCCYGEPMLPFFTSALGLLFLGQQKNADFYANEVSKKYGGKYHSVFLLSCAYAGTGDVLKSEYFLGLCRDSEDFHVHGAAVLGIAMVAMGEEVEVEKAICSLKKLLLDPPSLMIRKAVPLALALLCISNPRDDVTTLLDKCYLLENGRVHMEIVMTTIISLGLIGAGTKDSKIARMLRQWSRDSCGNDSILFCVRIAQGLLNLGKGSMTLSPYHSEGFVLSRTALAGIVLVLHSFLNLRTPIRGSYHYFLYFLALAMRPSMLMTVDENLKPLSVPVKVGYAGRTDMTPVLLFAGDKARLATDEYVPLSPILEGFVILKQNTNFMGKN